MTPQDYLSQAKQLDQLIRCEQLELEQLKALATGISALDYSQLKVAETGKGNQAKFTETVEKILLAEAQVQQNMDRLLDLRLEMRKVIDQLENPKERVILKLRYLYFRPWDEIEGATKYSLSSLHRYHKSALEKIIF